MQQQQQQRADVAELPAGERWMNVCRFKHLCCRYHIKMSPHEKKSTREEIITELIRLPILKYRRSHKKFPHYRIASPKKSSPGRQFTGKNPSRPGGCRAKRIFAGNCRQGGRLFRGVNFITKHRRCWSAAAATYFTDD